MKYKEYEKLQDIQIKKQYDLNDQFNFGNNFQDDSEIYQDRKIASWDVPLKRLTICISSAPGDGKDHTYRYIINQLILKYGEISVHVENENMYNYFEVDHIPSVLFS